MKEDPDFRNFIIGCVAMIALICMVSVCAPQKAKCAWCPEITCYDSMGCPDGCVCLIEGGEVSGECVSIE